MNDRTTALINETIKVVTNDPTVQMLLRGMAETMYSAGFADGLKHANKIIEEVHNGK